METATTSPPKPEESVRWERIVAVAQPAPPERAAWLRYAVAIGLVLAMTGTALLLRSWLNPGLFAPYFLAVALASWFGGFGPGLAASLLSVLLANAVLLGHGAFTWTADDLPRIAIFLLAAVVVSNVSASQRRTETALRASETRLRAMMDTASEGIWLVEPGGRTLYANDRMAALLGVEPGALAGAEIAGVVPAADLDAWRERVAAVVAGESQSFDGRIVRADGEEVVVSVGASPVRGPDGAVAGVLGMFTDISERVRAERALARANERFALAAEAVQELVYDWDLAAGLVYRSPGLRHVAGVAPGEAQPTAAWWLERIHPDDRGQLERAVRSPAGGDDRYVLEYRVRHEDGRHRIVQDVGRVVRDAAGTPARAVGSIVDVTERTETERALRVLARASDELTGEAELERRVAEVARLAVPDLADWCAFDLVDERGGTVRAAAAPGQALVAWRPPAAWVRTGGPALAPAIADAPAALTGEGGVAALQAAGAVSLLSVPLVAGGGRLGTMTLLSLSPGRVFGDRDLGLATALARRSALAIENARLFRDARAAEARYRGVFEGVRDAIVVIDEAGAIVEANAAAADLAAEPAEDLRGRPFADLLASGADWRDRIRPALRQDGVWRGEADARGADGETTPVDLSVTEVALPDGRSAVAVLRDVRERRDMERMQEEFLASVAHDLKNPLAAVRGQAQLLRRRAQKGEPIERERLLSGVAGIDEGAGRMARMIDDLVDVARLRGGQTLELRRQPVDLVALVRQMVEEAQRSDERCAVRFAASEESLVGMWDGTRIERVLANLIGNALKYSPGGGDIMVAVSRDTGWGEPCAVIAVTDRGVGIPPADLPYIFERFRRGRNVGGIRGSGIGLAGARSIVEGHGGTIAVESAEGVGSTFTVRLPLDGA